MPPKLLIFPLGGTGLEALDCLGKQYEFIGFIDDAPHKQGRHPQGFEVFSRAALARYPEAQVLAVQGSPLNFRQRASVIQSLAIPPERFATVIHPNAHISRYARLGYNTLIMAGVSISIGASLGNHLCVLPNSVIHHDVGIGDYCIVGALVVIAGHTQVGKNCFIGSGSRLMHNIRVGEQVLVGLGSNVLSSVDSGLSVVGNPARPLGSTAPSTQEGNE
ncbi:MAG: acetyltransferase [Bacteroidia bacterium]|nr:acetyltransferase [Bacteroidia bacterium]